LFGLRRQPGVRPLNVQRIEPAPHTAGASAGLIILNDEPRRHKGRGEQALLFEKRSKNFYSWVPWTGGLQ
jgi:hypothetical protein